MLNYCARRPALDTSGSRRACHDGGRGLRAVRSSGGRPERDAQGGRARTRQRAAWAAARAATVVVLAECSSRNGRWRHCCAAFQQGSGLALALEVVVFFVGFVEGACSQWAVPARPPL